MALNNTGPDADILPTQKSMPPDPALDPTTPATSPALVPGPAAPAPPTPAAQVAAPSPYAGLPPHQAVFEPQHQGFDWNLFNDRFSQTVKQFIDQAGTWPAANVARDLARSALPLDAVGAIAQHMTQNPPPPSHQMFPDEVAINGVPPAVREAVRQKPFFSVPNAPFQGVLWDAINDRFLVNEKEKAPASAMNFQFLKAAMPIEQAIDVLNNLRTSAPQKIASVMSLIDRGDYQGAALTAAPEMFAASSQHITPSNTKQPGLFDSIIKGAQSVAGTVAGVGGTAAGVVAQQVDQAHTFAVNTGLGTVEALAKIGLIHQDESNPLGVGLGSSAPGTVIGQGILKGQEAITGKSQGANVALTPEGWDQLQKTVGPAHQQDIAFLNPKNASHELNPLERAGAAGTAAMNLGSLAFAPTLAWTAISSSVENSALENGAPPLLAHTLGVVTGLLSIGSIPRNLGTLGRVGVGAGAVAGGVQAYAGSDGEDPLMRAEDVAFGSAMGAQLGGGVGRGLDAMHMQRTVQQNLITAMRSDLIHSVDQATQERILTQAKSGLAQQAVADAKHQDVEVAKNNLDALAPKEAPPARLSQADVEGLQKRVNEVGRTSPEEARRLQQPIDREMNLRFEDEVARKQAIKDRISNDPAVKESQAALERADTPAARAIAQRDLNKATNAAQLTPAVSNVATIAKPTVTENRAHMNGLVAQVKVLSNEIAHAKDPAQKAGLMAQRQELVTKANDHAGSSDLGKTPTQLEGERELFQATADLQLANKRDTIENPNAFSKEASDALDRVIAARRKIDESAWMNPIRKILNNEWVDAAKAHAIEQAKADRIRAEVQRQVEGDQNTMLRRSLNTLNTHLKLVMSEKDPASVLASGSRHAATLDLLAQKAAKHIVEVIGYEPSEKWQQFREAFWHPETLDSIADPALRQAVIDTRAGFADMAGQIGEEAKNELIKDYFPLLSATSKERFQRVLSPDNPLPVSTTHLHERVQPSGMTRDLEAEGKENPAQEVGSYFRAMGRAIANQQIRAAFKESVFEKDNAPVFISFDDIPAHAKPPDNGHQYIQSGLAGLDGWVEKNAGLKLQDMTTSHAPGNQISDLMAGFNNVYKRMAMISPQHFWNQVSSSLGADIMGPLAINSGKVLRHEPELLADAARHMYVQMEGVLAEMSERAISKDPQLAPFLDGVRSPLRRAYVGYEYMLWERSIKNMQLGMYEKLTAQLVSEGHGLEDAKIAAGHLIGQVTGVGNPKMLTRWERGFQRYVAFAYQWNKKHITVPAEALPFAGRILAKKINPELTKEQAYLVEAQARKYIGRYAAVSLASLTAANILFNGHAPWENEKGHELDLEWTRFHDLIYGSDGQRHYIQFPAMNFARFYQSKAQVFTDYGPKHLAQGALQNLANVTMPLPSWAITTALGAADHETTTELAGRSAQTLNPFMRNLFGPIAKEVVNDQRSGQPLNPLEAGKTFLKSTMRQWLGLTEYTGEHRPYVQHDTVLQNERGVDLVLALEMNVNPLAATAEQRDAAQKKLDAGNILGINPNELAVETLGAPIGTGSPYSLVSRLFQQRLREAVLEQGVSPAALDKAIAEGKSPFSLLDPTQKKLMFVAHPEIGYALNAASTDPDPRVRQQKADLSKFYYGLQQTLNENHLKQQQLDEAYTSGKLLLKDWISNSKDLRTKGAQAYEILAKALNPEEQALINKPPSDTTPLLPSEQAYFDYHQISLSDDKYQNDDGTQDVKQWRADQQTYLNGLPYDQQQYIRNRDLQNRTDLEKTYFKASDTYAQFRVANQTFENERTVYDQLTPFQRKLYLEQTPELKGYFDFREQWFRQNPDIAKFFHPLDRDQWEQWNPTQQAMNAAQWYIDSWGSAKEQGFLTAWQKQVTQDPKLFGELSNKWTPQTYQMMQDAINQYYNDQAAQRANFHDLLQRIFAKGRNKGGYGSGGSQNALGG